MHLDISDKLKIRLLSAAVLIMATVGVLYVGGWVFYVVLGLIAGRALFEWMRLALQSPMRVLLSCAGIMYIGFSIWACFHIQAEYPLAISLLFLCLIWSSDTGAFVMGKWLRGPKMAITISPNKTWAGFVGALVLPAMVGFVYAFAVNGLEHVFWPLIAGAVIGLVGQSGDLLVSALKRHSGVKDSGRIIPGHGGLLDRIDALLLAAPVFLMIIRKLPYVFIS